MEKKVYTKKSEKVGDFLIGFLLIPLSVRLINHFYKSHLILSWFIFLLELIFLIYLSIKRRFIKIGLIYFFVVLPLVLAGTCLLIFFTISKSH